MTTDWNQTSPLDQPLNELKLRGIQRVAGTEAIRSLYDLVLKFGVAEFYELLCGVVTLLVGVTGIGKTVLGVSVLFAINQLFGVGSPRIRHVLWLTIDRTLRGMTADEIKLEIAEFGLIRDSLDGAIRVTDGFEDVASGHKGASITFGCIHSWFESKNRLVTDEDLKKALLQYDTIVFDEADWANDRVRRVSELSPHALQFSLTATPLTADYTDEEIAKARSAPSEKDKPIATIEVLRSFLRRFVIINHDAVADYKRAIELDACLKLFGEVKVAAIHHDYTQLLADCEVKTKGNVSLEEIGLYVSAAIVAIKDNDNIETGMRADDPVNFYSPHVIVRVPSIIAARAVAGALDSKIDTMYKSGELKNAGWGACGLYSGSSRHAKDSSEKELFGRKNGKLRHPFMRARNSDGRADENCKRVLVICDIGVRGMNHQYVNAVVDCTTTTSIFELIHFNYGRPIRWPTKGRANRASWHGNSKMRKYLYANIYIPDAGEKFINNKKEALFKAREFVENMREKINGHYVTWSDMIMARKKPDLLATTFSPTDSPFTISDRHRIQNFLANELAEIGNLDDSSVVRATEFLNETAQGMGSWYGKHLLDDPSFRSNETMASGLFEEIDRGVHAVAVLKQLEPQEMDSFTVKQLINFARNDPDRRDDWLEYESELNNENSPGYKWVRKHMAEKLQACQKSMYQTPPIFYQLDEVFNMVWGEWKNELISAGEFPNPYEYGVGCTSKALRAAAKKLFDLPDATNEGTMGRKVPYHYAILGVYRRRLKDLARVMMLRDDPVWNNKFQQFRDWRRS